MTSEETQDTSRLSEYLQRVLDGFVQSKNEYIKDKEECARLREANARLHVEMQEVREREKSHRYHLSTSREIISNLQESVSSLVPLKRDIKLLTAELEARDKTISSMDEEKEKLQKAHNVELQALAKTLEKQMEQITLECDVKIRSMERERDTQVATCTCQVAELNSKLAELEQEHKEKMNVTVLEYEERLQRAGSQLTQLRDQHAGLVARTDTNMQLYRKRLEELEEQLKQSEFKHFLANNPAVQTHSTRAYEFHSQSCVDSEVHEYPRQSKHDGGGGGGGAPVKPPPPPPPQPPRARGMNPLHVVHIPTNKPEKKTFNIVKKRKLYTDKDFII